MPRIPRVRRHLAAVLTSLALATAVLIPVGGAVSAASTSTTCPPGEGGPSCQLVITAPESVLTGTPFTAEVLVTTNGSTVANSDPCASKVPVTLNISNDEGLFAGPYTANASAGIATFSLTIPIDGSYYLEAYAGWGEAAPSTGCGSYSFSSGFLPVMAVTVLQDQPIAPCPDNATCLQTSSGTGSAATLVSDFGSFSASWTSAPAGGLTGCGAGPLEPNGVLDFSYLGPSPKTIIMALTASLVTKGIGQFNICWSGTTPFVPLGGGAPVTSGLLPACTKGALGPCVLFKKSNQYNVGFFGILAPETDPKVYPY